MLDSKIENDRLQDAPQIYQIDPVKPRRCFAYAFFKRFFDLISALILSIIFLPVMFLIAVMIRIDSPGKAIYKQERLGKNGKPFKILKFRTMRTDAEADGPKWAETDDDRCTKLGAKLRKCRLDELPQLWNILAGSMSFVGPRPERPCFYEQFEVYIHGFSNRLCVIPGLTGLAQVMGGYDLKPEEKIVYDMEYIGKRSLILDAKILFRTVKVIFTHEGAR